MDWNDLVDDLVDDVVAVIFGFLFAMLAWLCGCGMPQIRVGT